MTLRDKAGFFWGSDSPFTTTGKVCLLPFTLLMFSVSVVISVLCCFYEMTGRILDALFLKRDDN